MLLMLKHYAGIDFKVKDIYFALHPDSKEDNLACLKLGLLIQFIPNEESTSAKKARECWAHVMTISNSLWKALNMS